MRIIVVGCGRVGAELAMRLDGDGHQVTVIDKKSAAFQRLEGFTGETRVGLGFDLETLEQAGVRSADGLAAVTSGDNSNVLIARVARENFGLENVVARIQDPARAPIFERLGISTVASVRWATDQIARRLDPQAEQDGWIDPSGRIRLVEMALPDNWAGRRIMDLDGDADWRPVLVTRLGNAHIVTADMIGQAGDRLHIAVQDGLLSALMERLGDRVPGPGH